MHFIEGVIYAYHPDVIMTTIVPLSKVVATIHAGEHVFISANISKLLTQGGGPMFSLMRN